MQALLGSIFIGGIITADIARGFGNDNLALILATAAIGSFVALLIGAIFD